jgi:hypothetical protein
MNCPKGHPMDHKHVICKTCAEQKNAQALYNTQPEYLRKAVRGEVALRVTAKGDISHVMLFGSTVQTWCGKYYTKRPSLQYPMYNGRVLETLCPLCRSALRDAIAEATAA